jgi:hypothetical protein
VGDGRPEKGSGNANKGKQEQDNGVGLHGAENESEISQREKARKATCVESGK